MNIAPDSAQADRLPASRVLPECIEWLKQNPKKASFGVTAMGSVVQFFGELPGKEIGIPLEPLAHKGAGPLIADLSAGHAPAGSGGVSDYLTHRRAGKVKILAVPPPERHQNGLRRLPTCPLFSSLIIQNSTTTAYTDFTDPRN